MSDQLSQLVLIRHGQSRSNLELWISGQATCGGLTERGEAEAGLARDYLATRPDLAPDAVVVSTMRRAIETAEIVAEPTGLIAEQRAELIERIPGDVEGMTVDDYVAQHGTWPGMNWGPAMSPGGEDGVTFMTRVGSALDRVASESIGRTTWVVCHGFVIRGAAHHFARGDHGAEPPYGGLANASVSVWQQAEASPTWRLECYNDRAHTLELDWGTDSFV